MDKRKHILVAALFAALCFFSYSHSLRSTFILDEGLLLGDIRIRSLSNIPLYLLHGGSLAEQGAGIQDRLYYRPLAFIFPLLKYQFFRDEPFGYHVFNLAILFLTGYLLYLLCLKIQPVPKVAVWAGMLFCVHPLNGELVHCIAVDVMTIPVVLLLLGTLSFVSYKADQRKIIYEVLSLLCFSLAILFHEIYILYPAFIFLITYFVDKNSFKASVLETVPFVILAVCFLGSRAFFLGFHFNLSQNFAGFEMSIPEYTATLTKLFLWYISTLFLIKGVVPIYALDVVREGALLYNLLLVGVIALIVRAVILGKKNLYVFALLWLLSGFAPAALGAMVQPKFGMIFEPHWMVVPSFGFFLLTALALHQLSSRINRPVFIVLVTAIILTAMATSRHLGWLWAEQERFARYWVKESPKINLAKFLLASSLLEKGKTDEAKNIYEGMLENSFYDFQIYNNLGLIALSRNELPAAREHFLKAVAINPRSAISFNNLGAVYMREEQWPQARNAFLQALAIDDQMLESRLNLARLYSAEGRIEDAAELLEGNLKIDAHHEPTLFELTQAYLRQGDSVQASSYGNRLLQSSNDAKLLTALGSTFAQAGFPQAAFPCYVKAQKLDNFYPEVYLELGKLYGNWDMFPQAISVWRDGLQVAPNDERFKDLIQQANKLRQARKQQESTN